MNLLGSVVDLGIPARARRSSIRRNELLAKQELAQAVQRLNKVIGA